MCSIYIHFKLCYLIVRHTKEASYRVIIVMSRLPQHSLPSRQVVVSLHSEIWENKTCLFFVVIFSHNCNIQKYVVGHSGPTYLTFPLCFFMYHVVLLAFLISTQERHLGLKLIVSGFLTKVTNKVQFSLIKSAFIQLPHAVAKYGPSNHLSTNLANYLISIARILSSEF